MIFFTKAHEPDVKYFAPPRKKIRQFNKKQKLKKKIRTLDIIDFTRELSNLIHAGVSIPKALEIMNWEGQKPCMQTIICSIKAEIETGRCLGEALKKYPAYFNPLFTQLTLIGEQSGTLGMQLNQAMIYLEKLLDFKNKLKKALAYPCCVILFTILVIGGILTFIIPQFQAIFENFGGELPWLTQWVIQSSHYLKYTASAFFCLLCFLIPTVNLGKRKSSFFAFYIDQLLLKAPGLGQIVRQHLTAKICHLLAITHAASIPFPTAFKLLSISIKNKAFAKAIEDVRAEIKKGVMLHAAIANTHLFPKRVSQMVYLGSQSGTLSHAFENLATHYENQLEHRLEKINKLLEPVIISILGVGIGILIIAMYLPIFRLGSLF